MGISTLPLCTAARGCWALHCGWAGGPEAATPAAEAANLPAADRSMLDGFLTKLMRQDGAKLSQLPYARLYTSLLLLKTYCPVERLSWARGIKPTS